MKSLFFYDLETSGFNSRTDRIMQFGGQRTDMDLNPVGDPVNLLIKLTDDILPSPDAILVTGITPQQTKADGLSEAEFLKVFYDEIALPDTVFVGFNSVRFGDEFMRFLNWRNFRDAYEWQWKDGRGRWDLLDVVRMTRALRPNGIQWPFDSKGNPVNRLELLADVNKLSHDNAHDALSDVVATIELARLIKTKQPKLFDYLLSMRTKTQVSGLVNSGEPFVYSSGKYQSEYEKTTVAIKVCDHPKKQGSLVFDLRYDPEKCAGLSAEEIVKLWQYDPDRKGPGLPVKTLLYNRCPAVAPLAVFDHASQKRLDLSKETITTNQEKLTKNRDALIEKLSKALDILDKKQQTRLLENEGDAETRLYDGFIGDQDKAKMSKIHSEVPDKINKKTFVFDDDRLNKLLLLYKAHNFPKKLLEDEAREWEALRLERITKAKFNIEKYMKRIAELADDKSIKDRDKFILEELKLYGESLLPEIV